MNSIETNIAPMEGKTFTMLRMCVNPSLSDNQRQTIFDTNLRVPFETFIRTALDRHRVKNLVDEQTAIAYVIGANLGVKNAYSGTNPFHEHILLEVYRWVKDGQNAEYVPNEQEYQSAIGKAIVRRLNVLFEEQGSGTAYSKHQKPPAVEIAEGKKTDISPLRMVFFTPDVEASFNLFINRVVSDTEALRVYNTTLKSVFTRMIDAIHGPHAMDEKGPSGNSLLDDTLAHLKRELRKPGLKIETDPFWHTVNLINNYLENPKAFVETSAKNVNMTDVLNAMRTGVAKASSGNPEDQAALEQFLKSRKNEEERLTKNFEKNGLTLLADQTNPLVNTTPAPEIRGESQPVINKPVGLIGDKSQPVSEFPTATAGDYSNMTLTTSPAPTWVNSTAKSPVAPVMPDIMKRFREDADGLASMKLPNEDVKRARALMNKMDKIDGINPTSDEDEIDPQMKRAKEIMGKLTESADRKNGWSKRADASYATKALDKLRNELKQTSRDRAMANAIRDLEERIKSHHNAACTMLDDANAMVALFNEMATYLQSKGLEKTNSDYSWTTNQTLTSSF